MEECNRSWEKSSDIPPALIAEFENGSKSVVTDYVDTRMGQSLHVLGTSLQSTPQPPRTSTRPVNQESTGYVSKYTQTLIK